MTTLSSCYPGSGSYSHLLPLTLGFSYLQLLLELDNILVQLQVHVYTLNFKYNLICVRTLKLFI